MRTLWLIVMSCCFACVIAQDELKLVTCKDNNCFTTCQANIPQFATGQCVSGSGQQALCNCSIAEWECTAQCGCFSQSACETQQSSWGSRCTIPCGTLSNNPNAGPTPRKFLSFDTSDETAYALDILFVVLCILAGLCCLLLLLTIPCCLFCNRTTTEVVYTTETGGLGIPPVSPTNALYGPGGPTVPAAYTPALTPRAGTPYTSTPFTSYPYSSNLPISPAIGQRAVTPFFGF